MNGPKYIPGDFYRICDRCGSKFRASQTYRTWDGLFVCAEDFETRHPQDFVRGTKDLQNVPDPRPEALETIIGPLQTAIRTAAATAATTINVDSSVRFFATDTIGVMLDSGNMERHVVGSVPTATSIILAVGLGSAASVGNVVINYSAVSLADIG